MQCGRGFEPADGCLEMEGQQRMEEKKSMEERGMEEKRMEENRRGKELKNEKNNTGTYLSWSRTDEGARICGRRNSLKAGCVPLLEKQREPQGSQV